ncbi:MAG: hypothetical protein AB7C97_09410 [Oscillospiraceae bacterium]
MMRKFFSVLFTVLLFAAPTVPAYAAETDTFTLNELDMKIEMPSDLIVFTRDIDESDPNLAAYGFTKEDLLSIMTSGSIYLDSWNVDLNYEILITMISSPIGDFNLLSDSTLLALATSITSEYESAGITYIGSEIYQHAQTKFLKIYISQPNGNSTSYGLQYYTVYDGKAINITIHSFSGQIAPTNEAAIKSIVDSAEFAAEPQAGEADSAPTSASTYTDSEAGMTFTVPPNWSEEPLSEESEYYTANFVPNEDAAVSILYIRYDFWNNMTVSERAGYTRSDINNSLFTESDVAGMCGFSASEVEISSATYNDIEYFKCLYALNDASLGLDLAVNITQLIYFDNGYMYLFQFSGIDESEYFADFESLVKSVNYQTPVMSDSSVNLSSGNYSGTSHENISGDFTLGNLILSLIVTISVYSLPIIVYRYAIIKKPVGPRKARKITIIYAIVAFSLMTALIYSLGGSGMTAGGLLLWSFVNYSMLTGGKEKTDASITGVASDDPWDSSNPPDGGAPDESDESDELSD